MGGRFLPEELRLLTARNNNLLHAGELVRNDNPEGPQQGFGRNLKRLAQDGNHVNGRSLDLTKIPRQGAFVDSRRLFKIVDRPKFQFSHSNLEPLLSCQRGVLCHTHPPKKIGEIVTFRSCILSTLARILGCRSRSMLISSTHPESYTLTIGCFSTQLSPGDYARVMEIAQRGAINPKHSA